MNFKDINKISEAKGFSGVNASWTKTDSGMAFKWTILKNGLQSNTIGELLYVFSFDGKVTSSNGIIEGETVKWAITPTTYDYTEDIILTALVNKDKSSCGLFGIEFPLIVGGLIFVFNLRERKKFRFLLYKYFRNHSVLRLFKFLN